MTGDARVVLFRAWLDDLTANTTLYSETHYSFVTPNESFALGAPGGDFTDSVQGSRQGTLLAGNEYRLLVDAAMFGTSTSSATATGTLTMLLPEPGTGLLLVLSLLVATRVSSRGVPRRCAPA
jgi:hypothetical protein